MESVKASSVRPYGKSNMQMTMRKNRWNDTESMAKPMYDTRKKNLSKYYSVKHKSHMD
jgi:hypothetical protein